MCSLEKEGILPDEIKKIFYVYQENQELFDACGFNFNKLSWEQLKDLVLKQTGEYENVLKLPNQFYESEDGLITIGYFNTFVEALNFEPSNGWCTSVSQGRFAEYHDYNHDMLYIIRNGRVSKNSGCRFVVAQVHLDSSIEFWSQDNDQLKNQRTNGGTLSRQEYITSLGDALNHLEPMKVNNNNQNNLINCNRNMKNKKVVRLTESQLHNIIAESVNRILEEGMFDTAKAMYQGAMNGMRNNRTVNQQRRDGANAANGYLNVASGFAEQIMEFCQNKGLDAQKLIKYIENEVLGKNNNNYHNQEFEKSTNADFDKRF